MNEEEIKTEATVVESPTTPEAPTPEPAEKPDKTPEAESPELMGPKEMGKAFAALRNQLKDAQAEVETLKATKPEVTPEGADFDPTIFEPTVAPALLPQGFDSSKYTDAQGNFNLEAYDRDVKAEQVKIARTEAVRIADEERQTREVLAVHPDLDPKGKTFNEDFYLATEGVLLAAMNRNKPMSYIDAANKVKGLSSKEVQAAAEAGAEAARTEVSAQEAANLEATSNSTGRSNQTVEAREVLRSQTRQGGSSGDRAIADRLKGSGLI